ncbi:MAG: sensor histidine kinase [Bacteroidetes bacterium]|nr:sensor histidine kinase [Bacteroidota bacterium]
MRTYWTLQLVGWSGYALFRLVPGAFLQPLTAEVVTSILLTSAAGVLVTDGFRRLVRRWGWKQMSLAQLAPRVLSATLLMGFVSHFVLLGLQRDLLGFRALASINSDLALLVHGVSDGFFIYLVWSLLYFTITYFRNYQEAEVNRWKLQAQMEASKLEALKLQLNPHFLFNSLNSVRALIAERPRCAQHMVTRLARLLRTALQSGDTTTVPLEKELDTVRVYLELEAVRFEDRLRYEVDADDDLLKHEVPFLLVQTLVENAIKHGIANEPDGGTVTVTAVRTETQLRLRVENPGQITRHAEERGVGLENARERLRLLFGARADLTLQNIDPVTVRAEVCLPLHETASGDDVPASSASLPVLAPPTSP